MQSKVELYYNYRFCNITLSEIGVPNWNLPMNENRFKIYKNSNTVIQFILRNNDRKPLNLSGKCFYITINDEYNIKTLMHKPLQVVDEKQGQVKLVTRPHEVHEWPLGSLNFNVSIDEGDGKRLLYLDQMETARGTLQVHEGPYVGPRPSQHCTKFLPLMVDNIPSKYRVWSDILAGSAKSDNFDGVQTASIKLCNFSGRITVYGSLEKDMPTVSDSVWFTLNTGTELQPQFYQDLSDFTGNIHYDFTARNNWTVFAFDPTTTANMNAELYGNVNAPVESIKEIWYRN